MINKWLVYIHENVEPILSLVLRSKCSGIAQVVETSNAESPTPVYVYRKHSWQLCSNCQIITASKPKRTVTPYMYICLPNLCPLGLLVLVRRYKDNTFTLKTTLFGWQSMIPRSDLTSSNINMSKNSTFAYFFLLKSLYYQWLFVYLQRQSSPSLLTMLKSCEAFFVYTHLNMANLIPFTKRFESSENLVNLLESRGLQICDRNQAIQYLDNIGYYRLSAYMYPLLKMPKTAHFDSSYFLDSSKFNETMRAISKEYSKSKEEFILHLKRTYSEPYPPSWILGELLTLIFVSSSTFLMLYPPIMICNPN